MHPVRTSHGPAHPCIAPSDVNHTFSMEFKNNRKSKAPWQLQPQRSRNQSNPYSGGASAGAAAGPAAGDVASVAGAGDSSDFLHPGRVAASSRKSSRRLSIHASVNAKHATGFHPTAAEMGQLPGLPQLGPALHKTATNNSDMASIRSHRAQESIVSIIKNEMRHKDAPAIDDFYKSLCEQKKSVEKNIKTQINRNQKNILQLTDNLQLTQQELLLLRVSTKDLYEILSEFTDSANRRLELEAQESGERSTSLSVPGKRRDRSSVMVLQKMWASELQLLYKHVDGAHTFIKPSDERHIVAESGRWHEINLGTWKPTKAIHLFILNDCILIAARKLSLDTTSKRLQAVHCWPLHSVECTQVQAPRKGAEDESTAYAINIRSNNMSYVYQTDRYDHYMRVMNAYHKGKNEVVQKQREIEKDEESGAGLMRRESTHSVTEEGLEKRQLRESLRNSGLGGTGNFGASTAADEARTSNSHRNSADYLLKDISARVHQRNRSHDFKKHLNKDVNLPAQLFVDLKTNEDKLDEVDVNLSHNEYMNAVGLIKHIESRLGAIFERIAAFPESSQTEELRLLVDVVKLKIDSRKEKVQQGLAFDFNHNIQSLSEEQISSMVEFYLSFGKFEDGFNALLGALSNHLSLTVGKLISSAHGSTRVDIVNYLSNLIIVYVSIVKRAVRIYRTCIEPVLKRQVVKSVDLSGFVTWAVREMQALVDLIKKHASGSLLEEAGDAWVIKDSRYYLDLLAVMEPQLDVLKHEGLNVDFLFDEILIT